MRMATMKEIADLAGVSTATVSHVVNGTKKLSPETTERVLMAIQQLNYTPKHACQIPAQRPDPHHRRAG